MPSPTMRHLEFCQNKFPCEMAPSVNTVAYGSAESVVAHRAGRSMQPGGSSNVRESVRDEQTHPSVRESSSEITTAQL